MNGWNHGISDVLGCSTKVWQQREMASMSTSTNRHVILGMAINSWHHETQDVRMSQHCGSWTHVMQSRSCEKLKWNSDTTVLPNTDKILIQMTNYDFFNPSQTVLCPRILLAGGTDATPWSPSGDSRDRRLVARLTHTHELQGGPQCMSPSSVVRSTNWTNRKKPFLSWSWNSQRICLLAAIIMVILFVTCHQSRKASLPLLSCVMIPCFY